MLTELRKADSQAHNSYVTSLISLITHLFTFLRKTQPLPSLLNSTSLYNTPSLTEHTQSCKQKKCVKKRKGKYS